MLSTIPICCGTQCRGLCGRNERLYSLRMWRRAALYPWLRRNAIALASVVVSICALGFTINAARVDLYYKELSIKPVVHSRYHREKFSVGLSNWGLGPAVITDMVFRFDGKCFWLKKSVHPTVSSQLEKHLISYFSEAFSSVLALKQRTYTANLFLLDTPAILATNQEITFFSFAEESAKAIHGKLMQADPVAIERVNVAWYEAAQNLPYGYQYCSLTGKYCDGKALRACSFFPSKRG